MIKYEDPNSIKGKAFQLHFLSHTVVQIHNPRAALLILGRLIMFVEGGYRLGSVQQYGKQCTESYFIAATLFSLFFNLESFCDCHITGKGVSENYSSRGWGMLVLRIQASKYYGKFPQSIGSLFHLSQFWYNIIQYLMPSSMANPLPTAQLYNKTAIWSNIKIMHTIQAHARPKMSNS